MSITAVNANVLGGWYGPPSMELRIKETFSSNGIAGMQTPISLPPPSRYAPDFVDGSHHSSLNSEPAPVLYKQVFSTNSDLRVGHLAGALTLMWFNPVENLIAAFHGFQTLGGISLGLSPEFLRYSKYLVQTSRVPLDVVKTALLYVMRFRQRCKSPIVGAPSSEARLLAVALMVADKYVDDVSYTTSTWSNLSRIELPEMKRMETEFLRGIEFNLHISEQDWTTFEIIMKKMFTMVDSLAVR